MGCNFFCLYSIKKVSISIFFSSRMMKCIKVSTFIHTIQSYKRYCHFESKPHLGFGSLDSPVRASVGIFWDLDNKPPKLIPPFDAATKLKKAAGEFGVVRFTVAYANRHAFSYVPPLVRHRMKEKCGVVKVKDPYICRVCGRRFYTNEKLVNHFKQIHECEHTKRLNQIESARGKMRVKLVSKYAMKMDKYKYAVKDVLTPKVGYGLADELKRAGFWVRTVSDKPQAADITLRNHLADVIDKRMVDYVVLVSDDSDFVEVLKEARLKCLKTVVVGDSNDGALKRTADAAFSWKEIMMGKAKKEAVSVVGRWKDRDVLKRLEWTYDPEVEKKMYSSEVESDDSDGFVSGEDDKEDVGASLLKEDAGAWWKLD